MTDWILGEPQDYDPGERYLLKSTNERVMEGSVHTDWHDEPVWVPGDNSGTFTAADLREIADLLEGA